MEAGNSAGNRENTRPSDNERDINDPSAVNPEINETGAENPDRPKRSKTDPLNMNRPPLKDHSNPVIRGFAKTGYTIWIIVLAVGLFLAFVVSLFLV